MLQLVAKFKNINYNYSSNPKFLLSSVQHKYNEDDFIFNATLDYKVPFEQLKVRLEIVKEIGSKSLLNLFTMKLYTSLAYQMNDHDNEYLLESPTAAIDLCNLGTRGVVQILLRNFLEVFSTCIDRGVARSCPTPPVSFAK